MLAVWGSLDREAVPVESSTIIRDTLDRAGNPSHTILFIDDVRHNLNCTHDEGFDRPACVPPTYGDAEVTWIDQLARAHPASSAEPAPLPTRESRSVRALSWYDSAWVQLAACTVLLAGFLGYLLVGVVRLVRRRPRRTDWRAPEHWAAVSGLLAVLGTFIYIIFLAVTATNLIGPVFLGRPIPWLVLQACSVATVAATAMIAVKWWQHRLNMNGRVPTRVIMLLAAGLVFIPWGAYWGLLRP